MSKKKKRNSSRPFGFAGKSRPEVQIKRVVVFAFGLAFVGIFLHAYTTSDLSSVLWWQMGILGGMFLLGIYLMFIAAYPRQQEVNQSHEALLEASARSIFRVLLDKLF